MFRYNYVLATFFIWKLIMALGYVTVCHVDKGWTCKGPQGPLTRWCTGVFKQQKTERKLTFTAPCVCLSITDI